MELREKRLDLDAYPTVIIFLRDPYGKNTWIDVVLNTKFAYPTRRLPYAWSENQVAGEYEAHPNPWRYIVRCGSRSAPTKPIEE
jgi:hypothetical protein